MQSVALTSSTPFAVVQDDSPAGASDPESNVDEDIDYDPDAMDGSPPPLPPPPPPSSAAHRRQRPSADSECGSCTPVHCSTRANGIDNAKSKSRCRMHLGLELEIPAGDDTPAADGAPAANGAVATVASALSDLVKSLTPDQVQQIQETWKAGLKNGSPLNSPLQALWTNLQQHSFALATAAAANNNNNNNSNSNSSNEGGENNNSDHHTHTNNNKNRGQDDTPTPGALIYPQNVTTPQEAFAEGFQRALSGVYRKHQFEPRSQPACTPSTVKYILSLVTPSTGQPPALKSPEQQPTSQPQQHQQVKQQQQTVPSSKQPDLAAFLRQYISSSGGSLASPSALPYLQALTNGAVGVGAKSAGGASPVVHSPLLHHPTAGGLLAAAAAAAAEAQKGRQSDRGAALAYQQLLLSSPTAAATALSVVRAAEPPPGTATDRTILTDLSSASTDLTTKLPASLLDGLKLDPSHPRYMDFLHGQPVQPQPPQQQQSALNASSFLPNFGGSNPMMPTLNFGAGGFLSGQESAQLPGGDAQLFLSNVSQHLPSQPPTSQQQQQQCLLLGGGPIDVKQETDFMHDPAMPIPSSARTNSSCGEPSMKRAAHSGADFSDASSAGAGDLDGYGHGGNMFNDEDQEMKKLERKRARNRMAASKCRQRKLERISELEDQVRHYQTEGLLLQSEIHQLRRQLDELNETVSRHRMAGCAIVAPFKL